MISYDQPDTKSALEAKFDAQKIAFGPIVFQATMTMRRLGILELVYKQRDEGALVEDIADTLKLAPYGVRVLLEVGLSAGIVRLVGERFTLTKTGWFLLKDDLTTVNLDFVADVCYEGMRHLSESIVEQKPAGLRVFGAWETIYEALSQLPEPAQSSWFRFDHFYSDVAFPEVLPFVFERPLQRLVDVGGNTGKWTLACLRYDANVNVTILDLPGQLEKARCNIEAAGMIERVQLTPINLLCDHSPWPGGADAIWMSQFLDCFSPPQIVSLLRRAKQAMDDNTSLYILETLWDRQRFEAAAFSLHNTSLYFTCFANGNSKMYHSAELTRCIDEAGLRIVREIDNIGIGHTLLQCRR